ncbi:MAG: VTT domain-containing protein [Patescibacteria group bacterium]|jgi:membrane protein DedA with SNARE-associated domain
MHTLADLLINFSEAHRLLTYLVVFLMLFIEGEGILLLAGILIKAHQLDFFDTLLIAAFGTVCHDLLYWSIGRHFGRLKIGKFLFWHWDKAPESFDRNRSLYIFISKFTWGFNRLTLIIAGYFHTTLRQLLRASFTAAIIWPAVMVSLGYVFAEKTHLLKQDLRTVALLLTAFFLVIFIFKKVLRRTLLDEPNQEIK